MIRYLKTLIILFVASLLAGCQSITQTTSPDEKISLNVFLNNSGSPFFNVKYGEELVLQNSSLGMKLDDVQMDFMSGLEMVVMDQKVIDEKYVMKSGKKHLRHNYCNEVKYAFHNDNNQKMEVIFRVFNDAVAFSYKVYNGKESIVVSENSSLNFANIKNTWTIPYSSGDERIHTKMSVGEELDKGTKSFPVLIEGENGLWSLVTEANVSNYSLSSGQFNGNQLSYVFSHPKLAQNKVKPNFQSPWRVMVIGDNLNQIVESNVVDHLAPSSVVEDLSWIESGVTSFPWWGNNLANSFPDTLKKYIDLSADMGWRYIEFDVPLIGSPGRAIEQWKTTPWIKDVVDYGLSKGVLCYGWDELKNLNTPEKRADIFGRYNELGIRGIKVDFVNSYTQRTRQVVEELIQDAIKYKLMLSFHGAQTPRGFSRTYPHIMTFEAVKGSEYYIAINGGKGFAASHNCTLPFTRNIVGSMDYTPVAFTSTVRETTMAHELALSVIFESGWQGLCDIPSAYLNSIARPFLTSMPASWDETRFLAGYPGKYCCMARRIGKVWYVAGINAGASREVEIELPFKHEGVITIYNDKEGQKDQITIKKQRLYSGKPVRVKMDKNGGFAFVVKM